MSTPLRKVCPLCNFDVYILDLISIFLGKRNHQFRARLRAARSCDRSATAHQKAERAHTRAENRHRAYAQANPMDAQLYNYVANQHRAKANTHRGHAATYTAMARGHCAAGLNDPSHLSLWISSNSLLRARKSRTDARRS